MSPPLRVELASGIQPLSAVILQSRPYAQGLVLSFVYRVPNGKPYWLSYCYHVPSGTRPCITRYKRTKSSQCRDKTTNGTASRQGRDYASFMQNRLSISPSLASINRLYSSAKTIALGGGCYATVATVRKTFFGGTVIEVTSNDRFGIKIIRPETAVGSGLSFR